MLTYGQKIGHNNEQKSINYNLFYSTFLEKPNF